MKKSIGERKNYTKNIIVMLVITSICFLSIAYSAFSNTLTIENALAYVRPVASARITNLLLSSTNNGGISNSEDFTKDKIIGNITLPNADSTVTYKLDVTVFLSSEMKLTNITGLDPNLELSISGYTYGDILCDQNDVCNLGATDEMYITIGYKDGINNSGTTTHTLDLNFVFEIVNIIAKIGSARYQTLQAAVNDVPANNTTVVIDVIRDTSEEVTINSGQDVSLRMHGNTITSTTIGGEKRSIFENGGTLRISDGTFVCNAGRAAINNMSGTLYLSGGTVNETGSKQAINNENGGTVYISGDSVLTNVSNNRAVVQNKAGSTLYITGGTLTSSNFAGIENNGIMTIGNKDGSAANAPTITGKTNGVLSNNTSFNYYDGIIKGRSAAFNDETLIADTDSALMTIRRTETINGATYQVVQLGLPIVITFDGNGGTPSENSRTINQGGSLSNLPTATRLNYTFVGWYDDPTNGTQITTSTIFNSTDTIYAHWVPMITITFDGNGGTPSENSRMIDAGDSLGTLPTATRANYTFVGWYDDPTNGNQITTSTTFNSSDIIYAHWSSMILITFDGNGGTPSESSRMINPGGSLGTLPTATRQYYTFAGWYDDPTNGNQITTSTTFNSSDTIYAHWNLIVVATIGNIEYPTIQAAVSAAANSGQKTITLERNQNLTERISTDTKHNIIFDLQNYTISTTSDMPVFENRGGTIVIKNGTVTSSAGQGAINNRNANGSMTIENLTVNATGTRQAVYNEYGKTYIKSGCVLTNTSSVRAAVHNLNNGTIYITGGTITSSNYSGIYNASGTVEIGNKDGNINTSSPSIRGKTYGVDNASTFNFYDGIIKGKTSAHNGSISDMDGSIVSGSELIGSDTYYTETLQ